MNNFFAELSKIAGWWKDDHLSKLTDSVSKKLTEARQKLLVCDGSLKAIARTCIDDGEDAYQEAIFALKDGATAEALEYCKKSLGFLSLAMLHLSTDDSLHKQPDFKPGRAEDVILELGKSIAQFKTVVEYTNIELGKKEHDRYMEVVRLFYESADCFAVSQDERAKQKAFAGLLWMYLLSLQVEESSSTQALDDRYLNEYGSVEVQRVVDLINTTYETRKLFLEASEPARLRTNQYLNAANKTIEESIESFSDGLTVVKLAKAGKMEVRMARRLIESSLSIDEEEELDVKEEWHVKSTDFKSRVAYLQQVLKDNDPDSQKLVRRLQQVSSYYGHARKLASEGALTEAERYARSAHLDIDFARQLFSKGVAYFSDTI